MNLLRHIFHKLFKIQGGEESMDFASDERLVTILQQGSQTFRIGENYEGQ